MNSLWLIIVSLAAFAVAYRLYGAFLAAKVAVLNDARLTPAHRLKDGVDYHPTNKLVLFGHHFAAIAGPGPLIGPVLAAQWGFLPGFSWIVVGACLAGGVHDFVILWASVRSDGLSLPQIARRNIGPLAGITTSLATLFIIVAVLASVAIVVVNALNESPWGMFTVLVTIPAAVLTGLWMYKIRPGKVAEASIIGVSIVLLGVFFGKTFANSSLAHLLQFEPTTLKIMLPAYAFVASILPVWVLMCPRDYLSCYMKIGVMVVLGVGIIIAHPTLKMPATTMYLGGGGPVVPGAVWPFVTIIIMCGALSGFHALIASGTTPKMVYKESDIRPIGYGAMVVEGFVAVTALVAACALEPGDYFAINIPQSNVAAVAKYDAVVRDAGQNHWDLSTKELDKLEAASGEAPKFDPATGKMVGGLRGRTGGAVTLAVGMAKVFSQALRSSQDYWYHFIIMFEALFILTLLETGTRVARFVFQETAAQFSGKPKAAGKPNWTMNVVSSAVICVLWGYLLYMGDIKNMWLLLGIANQLLASIALAVATTYLINHAPRRVYALCAGIPFVLVFITVLTAAAICVHNWMLEADPGKVFLARLMAAMGTVMIVLTLVIAVDTVRRWWQILHTPADRPPTVLRPGLTSGQGE